MLDPFPLTAPEPLRQLFVPIANALRLPSLPLHVHEILFALALYTFIAQIISPFISTHLFPETYPKLSDRTKISWDSHVVSFVQSCFVVTLSFYVIFFDTERKAWQGDENWNKRIWGYTGLTGLTQSFALGYFLWDFYMSARYVHIFGWGMVAHAVASCSMFIYGYRPFVHFYCPVFLLHELSSPFLNIHWFCDKLGLTGSTFQAINGALLIATFFGCRLIWGTYGSIAVFKDVYRAMNTGYTTPQYFHDKVAHFPNFGDLSDPVGQTTSFMGVQHMPPWLGASYLVSNVVLTLLNFFWFSIMIQTVRKRFDPPLGTKGIGEEKIHYYPRDPSEIDQRKTK